MKQKRKSNSTLLYVLLGVIAVVILGGFLVSTVKADKNIEGYFAQKETFYIFNGLTLVPSTVLKCDLIQSIYYTDSNDSKLKLVGVGHEDDFIPTIRLDVFSGTLNNPIKDIQGELKTYCDGGFSSKLIDPSISGGNIVFSITGTDGSGKTKTIKSFAVTLNSSPQSVNGKTVSIAKWSLTASDIETALGNKSVYGSSGSYNYHSTITSTVVGTIKYKTFPSEKDNWTYQIRDGVISAFSLKMANGPSGNFFDDLATKDKKVELKLASPSDGSVDLRTNERVTIVGSLYDWESTEGYPILRVFYDDPSANPSDKINPVIQKQLVDWKGKTGKGNVADFQFSFLPTSTSQTGTYKITFGSAEKNNTPLRKTVATVPIVYIKSDPSTGQQDPTNKGDDNTDKVEDILPEIDPAFIQKLCDSSQSSSLDSIAALVQSTFANDPAKAQLLMGFFGSSSMASLCGLQNPLDALNNPDLMNSAFQWIVVLIFIVIIVMIVKAISHKKRNSMQISYPGYGLQ